MCRTVLILACTYLHSLNLDLARSHFEASLAHAHATDLRAATDAFAGLALTQQLLRNPVAASTASKRFMDFAARTSDPGQEDIAGSCEARLSLLQGEQNSFATLAKFNSDDSDPFSTFMWLESAPITRARILIALGSEESLTEALTSLHKIRSRTEAYGFVNQTIEIAVLQSLGLEKQGDKIASIDALSDSLSLAAPGGWIRPFIELGPTMMKMLQGLAEHRAKTDFLRAVLDTFDALEPQRGETGAVQHRVPNKH